MIDQRFLRLPDGSTFVPIGLNLCFPRFIMSDEEGLALYRLWIGKLSANGGNFIRLFLGHPFFDPEGEWCGDFRPERSANLRAVLDMASDAGVKVKLTFDHFRFIDPEPVAEMFPGAARFDRPAYHLDSEGVAGSMEDYLGGEAGRKHFLSKLDFFQEHFEGHPAVLGWELWNEIDAVRASNWQEWTEVMLPELRLRFPNHLCLQSLGSYDRPRSDPWYQWLANLPGNDCIQAHRYLDELEGLFPCCSAPMDEVAASAVRDLHRFAPGRPLLLAECGAVEPGHRAPSLLYEKDTTGSLLHDILFAPFFAGGAGPGQCWHWDFYVAKHDLWHHFRPFALTLEDLDPAAERLRPFLHASATARVYELRGKTVRLFWLRDAGFDWRAEFREERSAPLHPAKTWLPPDYESKGGRWEALNPWSKSPGWQACQAAARGVDMPAWQRSIVLRFSR